MIRAPSVPSIAILAAVTALAATADDRWIRIQSGPFEVMSPAGERGARHAMAEAEQFRYAVGELLGVKDPTTVWPIRILVLKTGRMEIPGAIAMGRDAWISASGAAGELGTDWRRACARILMDDNAGRMPAGIESGFVTLMSTLESKGPRVTLATPPAAAERTRDWARLHLFATQPEYSGRLRVLLQNMAHGGNYDAACRNAFEKPAKEMEKRVDAYFAAGQFGMVPFSGRALAERDFTVREVEAYDGRIALADALLVDPAKAAQAEAAYKALTGAEAQEGLAVLAERRKDVVAVTLFASAAKAGSKSARAWLGTGTREGAIKAIELNPKWSEPHVRLADLATAPNVKAAEMGKAATLAQRDAAVWKRAALAYAEANQFTEAGKAWAGAERAAATDEERETLRQARIDNERARADFAAAERRRLADEEARDLERIKNADMAAIRAAEAKANKEMNAGGAAPPKPEQWWDDGGGATAKAAGTLVRVDCLSGGRARLTVQASGKTPVALAVRDPGKVALSGAGVLSLGCGVQRPARKVSIEYTPGKDGKLGTVGDVRTVEFQ